MASKPSPEIAPGELAAESDDRTRSVLRDLQRDAPLSELISEEIRIKDVERIAGEAP